jgi:hypothetical protein
MLTDGQICEAMTHLGLTADDFVFESAQDVCVLKDRVRQQYRKLVLRHHPDLNEGTPSDLLVWLGRIVDDIAETEFVPLPRQRRKVRFTIRSAS